MSAQYHIYIILHFPVFFMRRLVIEGSLTDLMAAFPTPGIKNVKLLEILHFLNQEPAEFSVIARIEFYGDSSNNQDFFAGFQEVQLLDLEKGGSQVYYLKKKVVQKYLLDAGGFVVPPSGIHGDTVRFAFIGSKKQVDQFLAKIELKGVSYKLISLVDAKFAFDSPLNTLTEKQRTAVIVAFNSGYFDVPRRINSEQLAKKLHIHHSALNTRLRKAEHHLLAQLLKS